MHETWIQYVLIPILSNDCFSLTCMLKVLATEALTLGTTPPCSFDHTSATNDNTMRIER